jgi:hypothetical protein
LTGDAEASGQACPASDNKTVAGTQIFEAGLQPRSIVPRAGGFILMKVALVDTGNEQCVTLQIDGLAIINR